MNIITISREFGSGGRELGKRLADILGYDYYDREIISEIANKCMLDEKYVEDALDNRTWQSPALTFCHSFSGNTKSFSLQTELLAKQRLVIENIAQAGRNCIIVGRDADAILAKYNPFRIFVSADTDAKIQRCIERAKPGENVTPKEIERNMRRIDRARAELREIITGSKWGDRESYDIIVNTTKWNIKELAQAVADFASHCLSK